MKIENSRRRRGYTLIEILVALTIIGLIFSFGYVSFREFSRRQALVGQVRSIQGDLRLAQGMALAGQKPDDANCNSPNLLGGYYFRRISNTSYSIEADCTAGTSVIKSVNLPADITISSPSPNPILFKILGQGTNVSGSATITITQVSTGRTSVVTVTDGGEIK